MVISGRQRLYVLDFLLSGRLITSFNLSKNIDDRISRGHRRVSSSKHSIGKLLSSVWYLHGGEFERNLQIPFLQNFSMEDIKEPVLWSIWNFNEFLSGQS